MPIAIGAFVNRSKPQRVQAKLGSALIEKKEEVGEWSLSIDTCYLGSQEGGREATRDKCPSQFHLVLLGTLSPLPAAKPKRSITHKASAAASLPLTLTDRGRAVKTGPARPVELPTSRAQRPSAVNHSVFWYPQITSPHPMETTLGQLPYNSLQE